MPKDTPAEIVTYMGFGEGKASGGTVQPGYSAFIIGCPVDQGLREGGEILDIPVTGIFQTVIYTAAMLSNKFAIICQSFRLIEWYS